MANLRQMLKQLRNERSRVEKERRRLDEAIAALGKLAGNNPGPGRPRKARRKLSTAARRNIARAQKLRWAKVRKEKAAA